jgi:hypothetical protein
MRGSGRCATFVKFFELPLYLHDIEFIHLHISLNKYKWKQYKVSALSD